MPLPVSFRHVALAGAASGFTGIPWYVGDFAQVSVSIETQAAVASRYTFVCANDDGFQTTLGTPSQTVPANGWSILTTITAPGMYTFDPTAGFRWINVFRASASTATVTYAARW